MEYNRFTLEPVPTSTCGSTVFDGLDLAPPVMAPTLDPRMMQVHPRIKYNTIGGVNGPLVILDNVSPGYVSDVGHIGSS